MHIVLVEPEIPPNTGNIARVCAATRTTLHLIEPLGFRLDDTTLKRAGMDYWREVEWHRWRDWTAFLGHFEAAGGSLAEIRNPESEGPKGDSEVNGIRPPRLWLVESGGPLRYTEADFCSDDYLVFGRETAGLPAGLLERHRDHWLRVPMFNPAARSLNLSNCVAVVLYEALRQSGFRGELSSQPLVSSKFRSPAPT
jgi:tRNA (cytidine/uridine-2'-O-)-methyltransferase